MRPCPVSLLKVMALSVIHLQPLRLADYTGLVDSYLSSSHEEPIHTKSMSYTHMTQHTTGQINKGLTSRLTYSLLYTCQMAMLTENIVIELVT